MAAPRVFVLGNASIDVTLNVARLPRAGETLMARGILRAPGGKGLNQAVVAARAGAAVRFCAPLGREPEADLVRAAVAREVGLAVQWIDANQPSDLSTLVVAEDGENIIISTGDCAEALTPAMAEAFVADMTPADWLLVQGNLTAAATQAAVQRCRNVVFNTAPIRWVQPALLRACHVVVANAVEAEQITGLADPLAAALALGAPAAVVTLGGAGCILAQDGRIHRLPAQPACAVDTTGAGDIFCGMLAAALAAGCDLLAAVDLAQRAAAIGVARAGCFAAFPTAAELAALMG